LTRNRFGTCADRFPSRQALSERLALYQAKTEARIPLDFTTELLPAETKVQDKVELDGEQPGAKSKKKRSIRRRAGLFRNAANASANRSHMQSTKWIAARRVWRWCADILAEK